VLKEVKDSSTTRKPREVDELERHWQEAATSDATGTVSRWLRLAKELFDKDRDDDPTPSAA